MPQTDFGPTNIFQGNFAEFSLAFYSSGILTIPSSANLTITYTNLNSTTQVDTINLSLSGSFWVGTWSSSSALPGLATWIATSAGSSLIGQTGQIRILDP